MTSGGVYAWVFKYSDIQIYFLLIVFLQLCLFKFFLSEFGSEKVRSHWSHLELMVITVVTQRRGEPSATSRLVFPHREGTQT